MTQSSPVIFIVDDQVENCTKLEAMLGELAIEVQTFQSAPAALAAFQNLIPMMVILDADMPEMDGYQMINQMQADDTMRHIPVLLMTPNFSDVKQFLYGPLMEVIDTISKPISPAILLEKIKAVKELERYQHMIIQVLDDDGQAMKKKHEGVLALDKEGRIRFVNSSALRMLRTTASTLVGTYFESLFQDPCTSVFSEWASHPIPKVCLEGNILQVEETKLWCADGECVRVKMAAIPLFDQEDLSMFIAFKRLKKSQNSEEKLEAMMHVDQLTGLITREKFSEKLDQEIGRIRNQKTRLAVLYIDLLHFNNINESLGHHVGDEVLKCVADRLNKSVRGADFVGRIGGDVFTVVVTEINSPDLAGQVAKKILAALKAPCLVQGYEVFVSCNIGISTHPMSGENSKVLLKNADLAAGKAKTLGSDNYQYFSVEMNLEIVKKVNLESTFRRSLDAKEIKFDFMPIYQGTPKAVCGYEVVPFWVHEEYGSLTSEQFFPIAEQTGLMGELGYLMLDEGCKFLSEKKSNGQDKAFICFRVTPQQIIHEVFQERLPKMAEEYGLGHEQLILELCETQVSRYQGTHLQALHAMHLQGFQLLLANFGLGYAPFKLLLELPLNVIKLPSGLVMNSLESESVKKLLMGILAMSEKMGLVVWVDEINSVEAFELLKNQRIEYMQGKFLTQLPS